MDPEPPPLTWFWSVPVFAASLHCFSDTLRCVLFLGTRTGSDLAHIPACEWDPPCGFSVRSPVFFLAVRQASSGAQTPRMWPTVARPGGQGMPAARGVAFSAVGPLDLPPSCGLAHVRMGTEVRPHPSRTRASACSPRSSAGACQRTPRVRGGPAGARRPRGGHWGRGRGSLGSES